MEKSLFLKTNFGEIFAEIKNVHQTDTLASVRERVEITARNNFNFLLFQTAIKPKQESKTLVKDCSINTLLNGDNAEITVEIINSATVNKDRSPINTPDIDLLSVHNEFMDIHQQQGAVSYFSDFVEKTSAPKTQDSKLQMHTDEEISQATAILAKEKLRFHNTMVKKIEKDTSLQDWKRQELLGVIESSWVMKRTQLLKLKVKELVVSKKLCVEKGEEKHIMRNLEQVEKAHFEVEKAYEKFCMDPDLKRDKRDVLEKRFDVIFSHLKQCQGNLTKSLELFQREKSKAKEKTDGFKDNIVTYDKLSSDEMECLAEEIKTDYESN